MSYKFLEAMGVSKLIGFCRECGVYDDWVYDERIHTRFCPGDHHEDGKQRLLRKRRAFICLSCWEHPCFFSLKGLEKHIKESHEEMDYAEPV